MELAVAAHAHHGGHVVALELADQRVQHDAGEVALAGEPLGARHERVLVRAVQRVARLEGERALPLAVADQRARHARREHVLAVLGVRGLRQRAELAAEELRARVGLDHAAAGVVEALACRRRAAT